MGIIRKFFQKGTIFADGLCWRLSAPGDFLQFLRCLIDFLPDGSILRLEGCDTPPRVKAYLEERQVEPTLNICRGTLLPSPDVFHLPITKDNIAGLVSLLEQLPLTSVPTHLHAYRNTTILLQWYDASANAPLFISKQIPEECVRIFSSSLGCMYM